MRYYNNRKNIMKHISIIKRWYHFCQSNEAGRSMVEMLGVLAIIGVLSIGGIAGFKAAMYRYRANQTLDIANKFAVMTQIFDTTHNIKNLDDLREKENVPTICSSGLASFKVISDSENLEDWLCYTNGTYFYNTASYMQDGSYFTLWIGFDEVEQCKVVQTLAESLGILKYGFCTNRIDEYPSVHVKYHLD